MNERLDLSHIVFIYSFFIQVILDDGESNLRTAAARGYILKHFAIKIYIQIQRGQVHIEKNESIEI